MNYNHELVNDHRKVKTDNTNEELYPLMMDGNVGAHNKMIVNNIPLVIYIVESYLATNPSLANLKDDLVGEGLLGLTKATNAMVNNNSIPKNINPVSFISVTIRNHIRDYLKKEIQYISIEPDLLPDRIDNCPDELIEDILSCCDPVEQDIVDLWICGNTERNISEILNTPKTTIHRVITTFKNRLIGRLYTQG